MHGYHLLLSIPTPWNKAYLCCHNLSRKSQPSAYLPHSLWWHLRMANNILKHGGKSELRLCRGSLWQMWETSKITQTSLQLLFKKQLHAISGDLSDWTQCSRHFSYPHLSKITHWSRSHSLNTMLYDKLIWTKMTILILFKQLERPYRSLNRMSSFLRVRNLTSKDMSTYQGDS